MEGCQRPSWDSRLQLAPDQENYKKNEKVNLSCPKGFQPSFTHVKCSSKYQNNNNGTRVYKEFWYRRNSSNDWLPIQSSVECVGKGRIRSRVILCGGDPENFSGGGKMGRSGFFLAQHCESGACGSISRFQARRKYLLLCFPMSPKDDCSHTLRGFEGGRISLL